MLHSFHQTIGRVEVPHQDLSPTSKTPPATALGTPQGKRYRRDVWGAPEHPCWMRPKAVLAQHATPGVGLSEAAPAVTLSAASGQWPLTSEMLPVREALSGRFPVAPDSCPLGHQSRSLPRERDLPASLSSCSEGRRVKRRW